jgi:hypothetical protein
MIYMATDLSSRTTFVVEPARRGSRKLVASAMPAVGREVDVRKPWATVPLYLRKQAREALS